MLPLRPACHSSYIDDFVNFPFLSGIHLQMRDIYRIGNMHKAIVIQVFFCFSINEGMST